MIRPTLIFCTAASLCALLLPSPTLCAREVVAFWGFEERFEFPADANKQDFLGDVDATAAGNANLQAYLGVAEELDANGGGGFVTYTSPTSGLFYDTTYTVKFDDLKGGGDDFDISGVSSFTIDKNEGAGPEPGGDFGNDALLYLTFDGTGFEDFQVRFDVEGTPGDLPTTYDIFFRTSGTAGVWNRLPSQNNLPLDFQDYDPADPENMFAHSDVVSLSSLLDGDSAIELIINDFAENGNKEMELDNIEITANRAMMVPEPGALLMLSLSIVGAGVRRSRR